MESIRLFFIKHKYFLVGFLAIGFIYSLTMLPSQGFHDVGELQSVVPLLQIPHPTGFPSYVLVGYVLTFFLPTQDPAWEVNALSLLYSLGSGFFMYLFLVETTKQKLISFLGVVILLLTEPLWNYAGLADTHSFGRMFLALLLFLSVIIEKHFSYTKWFLFFLVTGVSLGGHLFIVYALPFLVTAVLWSGLKKKGYSTGLLFIGVAGFISGLSTYLFLPIRSLYGPQVLDYSLATWDGFFRHVSGSDFRSLMFERSFYIQILNMYEGLIHIINWLDIGISGLVLIGIGYGLMRFRKITVLLLIICMSLLTFASTYHTSDGSRYFGWILLLCSSFLVFGSCWLVSVIKRKNVHLIVPVLLLFFAGSFIVRNFEVVDKHDDYSARLYTQNTFETVEQDAIILAWWHYMTPLRYGQDVLEKRRDVTILTKGPGEWKEFVEKYIDKHPVYVVEEEQSLFEDYNLIFNGTVYKVEKRI